MATIKQHCEDCELLLGNPYKEVHEWLDSYSKEYPPSKFGAYHRQFKHNQDGVNEIRKLWGVEAEMAAKIHLLRDMDALNNNKFKEEDITALYEFYFIKVIK